MNILIRLYIASTLSLGLVACGSGGGKNTTVTSPVVNSMPTASAAHFAADADGSLSGMLMGVDADKDTLVFALGTAPQHGTVTLSGAGNFVYTPTAETTGEDSFSFTVSDGTLMSKPAQVGITVNPVQADFSLYSRQAFNQMENAQPMPLNTRNLAMDVIEETAYDDIFAAH
ncbi:MAG TPA: Ig-like domain-containing protein [Cellvibrionaceae bacterium]